MAKGHRIVALVTAGILFLLMPEVIGQQATDSLSLEEIRSVRADYSVKVKKLITVVEKELDKDKPSKWVLKESVCALGVLRAKHAVDVLIRVITMEDPGCEDDRQKTLAEVYPAFRALIEIGNPAVPKLLAKIAAAKEETHAIQLCREALRQIQKSAMVAKPAGKDSKKGSDPQNENKKSEVKKEETPKEK